MRYQLKNENSQPYEDEALYIAIRHARIILALPAGTGNTLVASWPCDLFKREFAKRILILEPVRFLGEQACGCHAIVTTARNALNDHHFFDFDAIAVDECRQTTGAYERITKGRD